MKKIPMALAGLLLVQPLVAASTPAITKLMETPASAFDLFLFRIYEAAKEFNGEVSCRWMLA